MQGYKVLDIPFPSHVRAIVHLTSSRGGSHLMQETESLVHMKGNQEELHKHETLHLTSPRLFCVSWTRQIVCGRPVHQHVKLLSWLRTMFDIEPKPRMRPWLPVIFVSDSWSNAIAGRSIHVAMVCVYSEKTCMVRYPRLKFELDPLRRVWW